MKRKSGCLGGEATTGSLLTSKGTGVGGEKGEVKSFSSEDVLPYSASVFTKAGNEKIKESLISG